MWLGLLTLLAAAALVFIHLRWRARHLRAQESARQEIARLKEEQHQAGRQVQLRQDVLLDSMIEGLLVLDERGRIQMANRAFNGLFGLTVDIRSRTIIEALRLNDLVGLVDRLETEKQVLGCELRLPGPAERWVQINGAAIFNEQGSRQGTILVFHDLTRLKQLERARKEFVANVSHELRTPLSLIKGYVETLLDGAGDNPEVATKFLRTIDRNAERLKWLIEDLLTISELESGRIKLNLQPVAMDAAVGKVLDDFRTRASARNVKLVQLPSGLSVNADPGRLDQVLANLVDNAIKYGRNEGNVTVEGRVAPEGWVEMRVEDDGPGIPAESLERVFERFYRVDKGRSREQGGTGLGLSIVKHIVQSHGGKVWARSQPGQGASFYFTLPRDSGAHQPPLL